MSAALSWIGTLADLILSLFPHLYIVDADTRAVKYPGGREAVEVEAGPDWYWPLRTNEPTMVNIARRTNMLNSQRLTTSDGFTVILSLGVVGRVVDAVKAVHETEDFDDDINQSALRAATPVVLGTTWTELTAQIVSGEFARNVKKKAESACKPYGYKVEAVFVADWCEAKVYAVVGDGSSHGLPVDDD
jgi:regulator of protease activity HflC (stomatin/prohibitin superfamily)